MIIHLKGLSAIRIDKYHVVTVSSGRGDNIMSTAESVTVFGTCIHVMFATSASVLTPN